MNLIVNIQFMVSYVYFAVMQIQINGVPLVTMVMALIAMALFIDVIIYLWITFSERFS